MTDNQPWNGAPQNGSPGRSGENQYGRYPADQGQGPWAQGPQGGYTPQQAAPQQKGSGLAALRQLFTPLNAGIGAGVLFLLTLLGYWLSWKSFSEDGGKATVNGFGVQKATYDGESMRGLVTGFYFLGLFVLLLIVVAAVLALMTVYRKIAALCLAVAGGIGVLYSFISLFTDFGMDKKFMGMEAGPEDDVLDWGLSSGIFVALVISLVTLAFGILYFLSVQGPLLPAAAAAPAVPLTGPAAVLRPVYVAGGAVVLFLLLVLSYILNWRSVGESGTRMTVNGLGSRSVEYSVYGDSASASDLSLFPLFTATFTFALILLGALVLVATARKKIGAVLIAVGAALALFTAFIGLVSDYGLFRELGGDRPDGDSASVGVFLTLFFSLVLLAVAVLYLLVEFGLIGGAKPQQYGQQYGQQFGQQYGQAPQPGQQYPPQNPGQTPPAQGRW
ncbi:hypothetical protein [uncultured Corynebacterium sp.]|uniref:hypothetical protein n=1 Tax=uncultured Corynebacterium sp. TaxID=159447 RepID=UPI0025F9BA25|nr:hypothetical protein [uncultured Corynebacterium sp.]